MLEISEVIANFANDIDEIPDETVSILRLSMLDWGAVGLAGQNEPVARIVREMSQEGAQPGPATMIGGGTASIRAAALVNGTTSHALDYDDTHFCHIGHPSVTVISAALAAAEKTGATGDEFVTAIAVGIEASIRVGAWLGRSHYEVGFHQTATAGSFGAGLAVGRLLGLTPQQLRHTIGLLSTTASGLKNQFGTMGKPFNAGMAAANGVEAALLVSRGFVSRPDGLETIQGFGKTHEGSCDDSALAGLGQDWLLNTMSYKFHACCHGTHASLEALREIAPEIELDKISKVTITTNPRWLRVCNLLTPNTGLEAKFSYRLTSAMALAGQDTGSLDTFSDAACKDEQLIKIRDCVQVIGDGSLVESAAKVSVEAGDEKLNSRFDLNRTISPDDKVKRLRTKARSLIGGVLEQKLWKAVQSSDPGKLATIVSNKLPAA